MPYYRHYKLCCNHYLPHTTFVCLCHFIIQCLFTIQQHNVLRFCCSLHKSCWGEKARSERKLWCGEPISLSLSGRESLLSSCRVAYYHTHYSLIYIYTLSLLVGCFYIVVSVEGIVHITPSCRLWAICMAGKTVEKKIFYFFLFLFLFFSFWRWLTVDDELSVGLPVMGVKKIHYVGFPTRGLVGGQS